MIRVYARFNEWLARRLSPLLLSMSVFWVLTAGFILGIVHPPFLIYFQAFSSNWYQGIALPIIGVAGAIAASETMKLIRETHDAVMDMHERHAKELTLLHKKHDDLHAKTDKMRATIKPKRTTK